MADSLLTSLLNMLDPRDLRAISSVVGEPEPSVSRGLHSSIAAVMAVLFNKAADPGALRRTLDLVPSGINISWPNVVEGLTHAESSLTSSGQRVLSGLFGS